jgi:hypothetical protein
MTDIKERRARVFISCGQRKDSDEPAIAHRISERLEALGFDTYIAVQRQSLRSLRENIFERLRNTEYFLFIDFAREELVSADGKRGERRGSLFAHQELAIASYLEIDVPAFRENVVWDRDGILGHLQANSIVFTDRSALPDQVVNEVDHRWKSNWRSVLDATLDSSSPHRAKVNDNRRFWPVLSIARRKRAPFSDRPRLLRLHSVDYRFGKWSASVICNCGVEVVWGDATKRFDHAERVPRA